MNTYDPSVFASRAALAVALVAMLDKAGFVLEPPRRNTEAIYRRATKDPTLHVLVYTSIVDGAVRDVGADAIRVCGLYVNGPRTVPLIKATRVHRTGTIEDVVARTLARMRGTYVKLATELPRCADCGAVKTLSKRDQLYCVALCWQRKSETVLPPGRPGRSVVTSTERFREEIHDET